MKTLKVRIKRVYLIKSLMFCASTFSNKSLIEETTKCLFAYIIKFNTLFTVIASQHFGCDQSVLLFNNNRILLSCNMDMTQCLNVTEIHLSNLTQRLIPIK